MKHLYPWILGFGVMLSCGACRQPTPENQTCAIEESQTIVQQCLKVVKNIASSAESKC